MKLCMFLLRNCKQLLQLETPVVFFKITESSQIFTFGSIFYLELKHFCPPFDIKETKKHNQLKFICQKYLISRYFEQETQIRAILRVFLGLILVKIDEIGTLTPKFQYFMKPLFVFQNIQVVKIQKCSLFKEIFVSD